MKDFMLWVALSSEPQTSFGRKIALKGVQYYYFPRTINYSRFRFESSIVGVVVFKLLQMTWSCHLKGVCPLKTDHVTSLLL